MWLIQILLKRTKSQFWLAQSSKMTMNFEMNSLKIYVSPVMYKPETSNLYSIQRVPLGTQPLVLFDKKPIPKTFGIFIGNHLCWSLFLIKLWNCCKTYFLHAHLRFCFFFRQNFKKKLINFLQTIFFIKC